MKICKLIIFKIFEIKRDKDFRRFNSDRFGSLKYLKNMPQGVYSKSDASNILLKW